MAAIEIRGTLTPQEQKYEYNYDPSTGGRLCYEYDTHSEAQAVALANSYIAQRIPTRYTLVHGAARVEVSDSNFPAIDTWQILANEVQKSRWDNPEMLRILQYGDGTDFYGDKIQILKQAIDNRTKWSGLSSQFSTITGADLDYLSNVYNLVLRGSDVYPFSQYVLRHTTNVGNAYNSNIADVYVDKVYTNSQLLTEVQDSSLWIFPLPGELQYFIQHLPVPSYQPGYLFGWLKRSATRTTSAFNRVDLTTEYWLEQWEQTQLGSR